VLLGGLERHVAGCALRGGGQVDRAAEGLVYVGHPAMLAVYLVFGPSRHCWALVTLIAMGHLPLCVLYLRRPHIYDESDD
jgi:hypothetical protein